MYTFLDWGDNKQIEANSAKYTTHDFWFVSYFFLKGRLQNSVSTCPAAGQTHFFPLCCRAVPPDNYIINSSFRNQRARTLDFLFKSEPGGWLQACSQAFLRPALCDTDLEESF